MKLGGRSEELGVADELGIRNEKLGIEGGAEWIVGGQ